MVARAVSQLWRLANRHAGAILLAGVGAVAWKNWRQWRRDLALLEQRPASSPLPDYTAWPNQPQVSVLVAAWNEAAHIEAHIRSFQALRYPYRQLVLCAGGDDGTYDMALQHTCADIIVLQQQPGEGKQRALRRCLEHAVGEVIYLTDADCELSDAAFLPLIAPIATCSTQAATGISVPKAEQRALPLVRYQWLIDLVWAQQLPTFIDGVLGRNCAISRSALVQIDGFAADVATGTDYYMSRRLTMANIPIQAVPESWVASEYPASVRGYLRMWRRWNKNLLIHGPRFGAWNDVRNLLIAGVVYSVILVLLALTPFVGPLALAASLGLFLTSAMNRLRQVALGARIGQITIDASLVTQAIAATALNMAAALLALHDAVNPNWRERW